MVPPIPGALVTGPILLVIEDLCKKIGRGPQSSQGRRKVGKSLGASNIVGHTMPLLVEIGLTDLPKSGGVMEPPVPTGLYPQVAVEYVCELVCN